MNRSALCAAALLAVVSVSGAQAASIAEELSVAELKRIVEKGEQIFKTVDAADSAWPKAYLYTYIESNPEEAAAVFWDIEAQKDYFPNVTKSKISKVIDAATVEVDYILEVPIVADEWYTVRDRLSSYGDGANYRIDWSLVRARTTKGTEGYVKFEPHGTGTLMAYYNFVTPGSSLAGIGMIRDKAMKQVQDIGKVFKKRVLDVRKNEPNLLATQIERVRKALGQN